VQAVAGIVGALHQFHGLDFQGKQEIQVGHVTVVAVAGNAVDEQLDRIHLPFPVETAKGELARGGAHVVLGQHDPGHEVEKLPGGFDVLIFDLVGPQNIH